MVERRLAKANVASSNLVFRSNVKTQPGLLFLFIDEIHYPPDNHASALTRDTRVYSCCHEGDAKRFALHRTRLHLQCKDPNGSFIFCDTKIIFFLKLFSHIKLLVLLGYK